jgi:hypothetical protein
MDRRKQASGREREIGLANSKGAAGARGSALEESYCVCVIGSSTEGPISYPPAFLPACLPAGMHFAYQQRSAVHRLL